MKESQAFSVGVIEGVVFMVVDCCGYPIITYWPFYSPGCLVLIKSGLSLAVF